MLLSPFPLPKWRILFNMLIYSFDNTFIAVFRILLRSTKSPCIAKLCSFFLLAKLSVFALKAEL